MVTCYKPPVSNKRQPDIRETGLRPIVSLLSEASDWLTIGFREKEGCGILFNARRA